MWKRLTVKNKVVALCVELPCAANCAIGFSVQPTTTRHYRLSYFSAMNDCNQLN